MCSESVEVMGGDTAIEDKMKIKYLHNDLVRDVKNEIGTEMIAAGLAEQVFPDYKPEPYAEVTWQVRDGARVGDFLYPPLIWAKCSRCLKTTCQESTKGTAHKTMEFRHLGGCSAMGVPVYPPVHITEDYTRRWAKYISLSRKKQVVLPALTSTNSAVRDRELMAAAGHKTREELIAETKRLDVPVVGR